MGHPLAADFANSFDSDTSKLIAPTRGHTPVCLQHDGEVQAASSLKWRGRVGQQPTMFGGLTRWAWTGRRDRGTGNELRAGRTDSELVLVSPTAR